MWYVTVAAPENKKIKGLDWKEPGRDSVRTEHTGDVSIPRLYLVFTEQIWLLAQTAVPGSDVPPPVYSSTMTSWTEIGTHLLKDKRRRNAAAMCVRSLSSGLG